MLLNVFFTPLHVPEIFQWVLIIGVFLPIALTFYYNKKMKHEMKQEAQAPTASTSPPVESRAKVRRRLWLMMACGSAVGLCAPFWLPLTGTTLGFAGDLLIGLTTVTMVCTILWIKMAKLPNQASLPTTTPVTPPAGQEARRL